VQPTTEGKFTVSVDQRKGIDFEFTSQELTLEIKELSERVIKPAMIQLANQVDSDVQALYADVAKWVGTPGQLINSNVDFSKGPESLDLAAVPQDNRCSTLSPSDHWGLVGAQTTLLNDKLVGEAYKKGALGMIGGVDTYMTQNVPTHTVGAHAGTPLTNGAGQAVTYAVSKDTNTQTLITDGWTSGAVTLNKGDSFTIADVFDVNPVTKATLPHLKQFSVVTTISDTTGDMTLTMTPAAISSGAHQTVSADIADGKAIVVKGTASTGYAQNMVFCKNAFALVMVPLVAPPGAVDVSRQSYKGCNVRVIPVYDGTNDVSKWRLDILYGVKTIDQRQAVRLSGTA
ncbi:MAG: P22 phage major capsid protein family protein, partial [Methylococcales bacterium]